MGSLILFRCSKNGIGQVIGVRKFNKTRVECEEKLGKNFVFLLFTITFFFGYKGISSERREMRGKN